MKVKTVIDTLFLCNVRLILSGTDHVLAGPCARLSVELMEYYSYKVETMTVSADCYDCLDMYIFPA